MSARIISTLLLLGSLASGCSYWEAHFYEGFLPSTIEVTENLFTDSIRGGVIEGCGVAIYRLSPSTIERINSVGIDYFRQAIHPRKDGGRSFTYSEWKETPRSASIYKEVSDPERSYAGMSCADVPSRLGKAISQSLRVKGSFYTSARTREVIVIPSLELAIFSYNK